MSIKRLVILLVAVFNLAIISACGLTPPAARFPQFNETVIAGPASLTLPQWSWDGRFLAYYDDTNYREGLVVYDTQTRGFQKVAEFLVGAFFDWTPDNKIAYLNYLPKLSGSPFPEVYDLHQVDADGQNDRVIATDLYSPKNFVWLRDRNQLAIILSDRSTTTGRGDVYILDINTGAKTLLVSRQQLGVDDIGSIAVSSDRKQLVVDGWLLNDPQHSPYIFVDLETRTIVNQIVPMTLIPVKDSTESQPAIGDNENWGWVGADHWILTTFDTPNGDCYNYALFIINIQTPKNSFCIPAVHGPFATPTISPDGVHIAYLSVDGPGADWLIVGELTSNIRATLANSAR